MESTHFAATLELNIALPEACSSITHCPYRYMLLTRKQESGASASHFEASN